MATKGTVIGGGSYASGGQNHFVLATIDLDAPSPVAEPMPLAFLAHGVSVHPREPWRAAVFEKKGPGACLVDLRARAVERPVETSRSRRFYGHGAWSPDGSVLYATESRVDRNFAGLLVARDGVTLRELGAIDTGGLSPHDCRLLDGGRVMAVTNGGGPTDARGGAPSVTFLDLATRKVLDRVALSGSRVNAGHVDVGPRGEAVVVSAPREGFSDADRRPGGVSILRPGESTARTLTEPHAVVCRMVGEALSVALDAARGVALVTHPLGDCVSMWRADDASSLGTLELRGPRGVALTLDRAWYVVSHFGERNPRLSAFSAETLAPAGFAVDPSYLTGSHVVVHDLGR
ncbi:MAG: DUF1513 domain-containing protein [Polyangiales bacterium]